MAYFKGRISLVCIILWFRLLLYCMDTTRVLEYASLARVLVLCQVPSAPDEEEDLVTPPLALLAPVSLSSSDREVPWQSHSTEPTDGLL